jgi:hypothetical protein
MFVIFICFLRVAAVRYCPWKAAISAALCVCEAAELAVATEGLRG